MCEITLHMAQNVNTEELQHCIPQKRGFFFSYIIVNSLRKGDNRDDDDDDGDNNNNKRKFIPIITGATGTISKSLIKYLSDVLGKQENKELQKIAIFGTAHTLL